MVKAELVRKLASQNPRVPESTFKKVVATILDTLGNALARGDRVQLRGFGTLAVKRRKARQGHNPLTGEAVAVPEKTVLVFRPGKEIAHRLNTQARRLPRKAASA
jgi:integration host factor subunit beta